MTARLVGASVAGVLALALVGGCGGDDGTGVPTLPPIVTTTTLAPPTTQSLFDQARFYTIVEGDNLTRIAQRFGVTVEALMAKNGITDPDSIAVGQVLELPEGAVDATATTSTLPAPGASAP